MQAGCDIAVMSKCVGGKSQYPAPLTTPPLIPHKCLPPLIECHLNKINKISRPFFYRTQLYYWTELNHWRNDTGFFSFDYHFCQYACFHKFATLQGQWALWKKQHILTLKSDQQQLISPMSYDATTTSAKINRVFFLIYYTSFHTLRGISDNQFCVSCYVWRGGTAEQLSGLNFKSGTPWVTSNASILISPKPQPMLSYCHSPNDCPTGLIYNIFFIM